MSLETVTSDSNGRLANHMQQQQFVLRIQKREGSQKYINQWEQQQQQQHKQNKKQTNNNNKRNAYKSFAPLTTIGTTGTGYIVSLMDTIINELSTNANIIILL